MRSRSVKYGFWALVVLVLALLGSGVTQQGSVAVPVPSAAPGYYKVTEVSDGDTIKVSLAGRTETVRLIGIDTPESKDPRKPVQCFARAAAKNMEALVAGKEVRLEADAATSDRDKYRRLLRYVYLPDGTFINQLQVQQGYGFAYTIFPNSKLEQFRAWEKEAREANRGLWAGCQVRAEGDKKQTQDQ